MRKRQATIPGFRAPPRPKRTPIAEMTVRELQDLYTFNKRILAGASDGGAYVDRIRAEQAAVESRLMDQGIDDLSGTLKKTKLKGEGDMEVDDQPEPVTSRTIEAKKKALAQYGRVPVLNGTKTNQGPSNFTIEDAMELERQAFLQEKERRERQLEKKKRLGLPIKGEVLTREEQEARIWAFMNHKPTESDMEDDSEGDSDSDNDPATWFEDDQDDGRKGQDIIEPDSDYPEDDLSDLIRVDESRIPYNLNFYSNEGD